MRQWSCLTGRNLWQGRKGRQKIAQGKASLRATPWVNGSQHVQALKGRRNFQYENFYPVGCYGSVAEGEHGKGGCRVGHELARMTGGVPFLIDRDAWPRARWRLIAIEPVQAFGNLHVVFWHTGSLENMQDKTGCVAVGFGLLRCAIAPTPRPEGRQAPAAVIVLLVKQLIDELLLFGLCQDSLNFRGRPESPNSVVQVLPLEPVFQIFSEQYDTGIGGCVRPWGVITRRGPDGDRSQRCSNVACLFPFPGPHVEVEPIPRPLVVAGLHLCLPKV